LNRSPLAGFDPLGDSNSINIRDLSTKIAIQFSPKIRGLLEVQFTGDAECASYLQRKMMEELSLHMCNWFRSVVSTRDLEKARLIGSIYFAPAVYLIEILCGIEKKHQKSVYELPIRPGSLPVFGRSLCKSQVIVELFQCASQDLKSLIR
jgi:hypothetical protein